jgi:hypothetical protein
MRICWIGTLPLCMALTGCQLVSNAYHNLSYEVKLSSAEVQEHGYYEKLALASWQETVQGDDCREIPKDYERGFKDGFIDFVEFGGSGKPPSVPPKCYWEPQYRTPDGAAAIQAWYAGFRQGVAVAQRSGYRRWVTLPTAQSTQGVGGHPGVPPQPCPGEPGPIEIQQGATTTHGNPPPPSSQPPSSAATTLGASSGASSGAGSGAASRDFPPSNDPLSGDPTAHGAHKNAISRDIPWSNVQPSGDARLPIEAGAGSMPQDVPPLVAQMPVDPAGPGAADQGAIPQGAIPQTSLSLRIRFGTPAPAELAEPAEPFGRIVPAEPTEPRRSPF